MGEAVMVYHSSYNGDQSRMLCNMCILPIKTQYKGPAPLLKEDKDDVIDEALNFFKANVLFRNYEVKGGADRVLSYLTYYIKQCLQRLTVSPKEMPPRLFTNSPLKTSKFLVTVDSFSEVSSTIQKEDKKLTLAELTSPNCDKKLVSD